VIWVLAGVGMLIGFEKHLTAIVISVLTVVILTGINFLESSFVVLRKGIYERLPFHKKKD
jgi:putative Mg2+ transporter-C (MgtC) family protein